MAKSFFLSLTLLLGCTNTFIRVHNRDGSTCTVDTSTVADPNTSVDPNINTPKASYD